MKKINVIYWSDTGNTEMMAKSVADGLIINNTPDDKGLEKCKDLGKMLR